MKPFDTQNITIEHIDNLVDGIFKLVGFFSEVLLRETPFRLRLGNFINYSDIYYDGNDLIFEQTGYGYVGNYIWKNGSGIFEVNLTVNENLTVKDRWCNATECHIFEDLIKTSITPPFDNSSSQIFIRQGHPNFLNVSDVLFINKTNNKIGIGINPSLAKLQISINENITSITETNGHILLLNTNNTNNSLSGIYFRGVTNSLIGYTTGFFGLRQSPKTTLSEGELIFATTNPSGNLNERMTIKSDGGVLIGSPTGGSQGTGTLNAVGVYDDGVLLTDYVFDKHFDGKVKKRDEPLHNNFTIPSIEDIKNFTNNNRRLPFIDGRDIWEIEGKPSVGTLTTQIWKTIEIAYIHIWELNDKFKLVNEKANNNNQNINQLQIQNQLLQEENDLIKSELCIINNNTYSWC